MTLLQKILLVSIIVTGIFIFSNCAGPGTVRVGVGVGVAGPWGGPYGPPGYYPGGTVWVGRPVGPVYYHMDPFQHDGREYADQSDHPFPGLTEY